MPDWGSYIDRQIRKAMEDGEFANLPGEGKPLNLEDDPHTPADMQMAYKILRDNDLAPDWIMQGRELEKRQDKLMQNAARAVKSYKQAASDPQLRGEAEQSWQKAQQKLLASADKLNREISTYNLKIPAGVSHRPAVNLQREITRLLESA